MNVKRPDLDAAQAAGILATPQVQRLWDFLAALPEAQPRFSATHVLYYFGGLIAIGAMSLFMTLGWERLGGWGLMGVSVAYGVLGIVATEYLLHRRQLPVPAGITATFVLVLVPLAIYGLQVAMDWRPHQFSYRSYHTYIDWNWLMMEYATLAAAAVLAWRYRLPFLLMPVAITLWYMSMDIADFLVHDEDSVYYEWHRWELFKLVTLWFGVATTLVAFWIDVRSGRRRDYAFWLYLIGVMMFWCGLTWLRSSGEWSRFLYFCTNIGMIAIGTVLARRVFAVFGAFGVIGYLSHLAYGVFEDSLMFPVVLSAAGFGILWLGLQWQRREAEFAAALRARLPAPLRNLLEHAQSG